MPKSRAKSRIKITKVWPLLNFLMTVLIVAGVIILGGLYFLLPPSPSQQSSSNINSRNKKLAFPVNQPFIYGYNVVKKQEFTESQQLKGIVNDIVEIVNQRGLPIEALSVSIIDLSRPQQLESSGYRNEEFRFPASISKLFWMVMFYAELNANSLRDESAYYQDLYKMMQKSDNEAASRFVDQLTDTMSGSELPIKDYKIWLEKRKRINTFFQVAGYTDIDISQKNFPIPYLKLSEPKGRERQMRGNPNHPIRNRMTTNQAARLMYEIFTNQAVSPECSQKMQQLLLRDLRPEVWKQELYNSVEGFLGESLPYEQIYFASKVGWTSGSRQEVAFVATKDGKTRYILAVFADHPAYAEDWEIFPKLSIHVFNRMHD